MKLSVGATATTHLLLRLLAVAVVLSLIGGVYMTMSHRDAAAAAQRLEQANQSRDAASWTAFQVEVAAQKRADDRRAARQAVRDKATADRAERQQAALDKAARAKAAREKAERQQIARAKAARERAAREAVIQERAEKLAAAREAARQKVADKRAAERAVKERAAEREARRTAARQDAARERARQDAAGERRRRSAARQTSAERVVTGELTTPDVAGALSVRAGGYPGQRARTMTAPQQKRLRELVRSVASGTTYTCPSGSGGTYRDIVPGARVSVRNGRGVLLASTVLTGGKVSERGCTFGFTAAVADADGYQVGVTRRGRVPYTRGTMVANGWKVALTAVKGQ